jgi:broad specificity phosphatase PhoE
MPPTLILIRHAQALHNVASDWSIHDPPLSELGEQQSAELHEALKDNKLANAAELIVVSPMRRTLQTASIGLDWLIKKGTPVLPDANWHETADKPCDTGSPISVMQEEFPAFDFSPVDPLYPDKTTNLATNPYAFTKKAIVKRGQTCLEALYSRPEKVIAVVSHSGFLRTAICNRMFFNADYRIFDYDEAETKKQGRFVLKEWEETEKAGGGMGRSDIGVFGIVDGDFPPEEEEEQAKKDPQVEELGEANRQIPKN